jgi:hypothetical protein
MRKLVSLGMSFYLEKRYARIERIMQNPAEVQEMWLQKIISEGQNCEFGKKYRLSEVKSQKDFNELVPINDYESLRIDIQRMISGENNVLWPGTMPMFAKSSGTTSDKSKFIPVTKANLFHCHQRGGWDTMCIFQHNFPNSKVFEGKSLLMGGSRSDLPQYPGKYIGDVSALMLNAMPKVGRFLHEPDIATALMPNFEEKLEIMAKTLLNEDIRLIGGVPTWTIVLFKRMLEISGKSNILEIWPNLTLYTHGGVSFVPYKEQFQHFIPSEKMVYQEIYNASEGFFAIQNDFETDDMLLLLDNGIYYEFLPMDQWDKEFPIAIPISEVVQGQNYAVVITNNSGLWRYLPGDTVTFTSTSPFKIQITGRTQQFVNAFGEEVMVSNTDKAIANTCQELSVKVSEYTVAPIFLTHSGKGGHQWVIEFEIPPENFERFNQLLDLNLQKINSDYEAKRYKDMALEQLKMSIVPQGTFHSWMRARGKFGGQSKVPRLSNQRVYVEELLNFVQQS